MKVRSSLLVRVLAFLQRRAGLHPRSRPGERLSLRSCHLLDRLSDDTEALRFQVALEQLEHDWDLFEADAANNDDALRLQVRVLELAPTTPLAERAIRQVLDQAPLGRLFGAVLAQAVKESVQEVKFEFEPSSAGQIRIHYGGEASGIDSMVIPPNLEDGIRGLLRFVDTAGYGRIRTYLRQPPALPHSVDFKWSRQSQLTLTLE
jgi:hypothetical protein